MVTKQLIKEKCKYCGWNVTLKESTTVGETEYNIYFCEKCHHQFARSE